MITQEELKKIFIYDYDTGIFKRISKRCGTSIDGKVGNVMPCGYLRIKVNGKLYLAHRLVFLYVNGKFPDKEVDHIDGVRLNNKWLNLREVSKNDNLINKGIYSNSSSGITGVNWHKQHRKWAAIICINGKRKHLGLFNEIEEAKKCRQDASKKYGFHINHGNELRT